MQLETTKPITTATKLATLQQNGRRVPPVSARGQPVKAVSVTGSERRIDGWSSHVLAP